MSLPPLPIDPVLPDLVAAVRDAGAAVLVAPPGAGKTTRVPPALLDGGVAGDGRIVMLEPRRVAARAAARRIAAERGVTLGEEVGFRIRLENRSSARTRILVVTEGILVAMLQRDPFLEEISLVLFDEFHERNLDSDLALAMVRRLRGEARPDLGVVAMSATLDPVPLACFLGGDAAPVPVIESAGRLHPVDVRYRPPAKGTRTTDAVADAVRTVTEETAVGMDGSVLVFLPGVGEIRGTERALAGWASAHDVDLLPLHGELPPEAQDRALRSEGERRRVVLATNVAESSVTVEGVTAVVDSGLARVPHLDRTVGLDRLEVVPVSVASCDQRAGRAGRLAPGVCVRLWSELEHRSRPAERVADVHRVDLAGPALQLLAWGETDLGAFPWYEAPEDAALEHALGLLALLGAVERVAEHPLRARVTPLGERIARLPLSPRLARLVLASERLGHVRRLALAAALLSERDPLRRAPPGEVPAPEPTDSDVLSRLERLEEFARLRGRGGRTRELHEGAARRILRARDLVVRAFERGGAREAEAATDPDEAVLRALLAAFPDRLARRRGGERRGVLVGGRGVHLRPESGVHDAELFLCVDVEAGRRGERAEAGVRQASRVEREWLDPGTLREEDRLEFDRERAAVVRVRRTLFEDLAIEETRAPAEPDARTGEILARAAAEDRAAALPLDDPELAALRARVGWLADLRPELDLPALDDAALDALLPSLCAGKRSFAELRRAPLLDFVRGLLTAEQSAALEREAPERIEVPSGSHLAIEYEPGKPPVLAVRIQEVFGWTETPRLAGGRAPLLLHLLAPNHRPQQVTDDLRSFWENTYPVARKELRRRYPKHAWPEDPWTASAERRPRRKR